MTQGPMRQLAARQADSNNWQHSRPDLRKAHESAG